MHNSEKTGGASGGQPIPVPETVLGHPAWLRLEDQLKWYDGRSVRSQRHFKRLKFVQVCLAILIPVVSFVPAMTARWLAALSGALIALIEAVQQMNQYSALWVSYRSTAERLKHEKFLFLSAAGPYRALPESERLILLAERVEEHVSTEHANWFNETRRAIATGRKEGM